MKLYPKDEARHMLCRYHNLDYLFNTGVLTVADKRGTQKYFDLTERVIDSENLSCDLNMTVEEFIIKNWWWEPKVEPNNKIREMIVNEIARFTEFLQIDNS